MNKYLTEIQIVNKHITFCSTSSVIRKQNKIPHLTITLANVKRLLTSSAGMDTGNRHFSYTADEYKLEDNLTASIKMLKVYDLQISNQ